MGSVAAMNYVMPLESVDNNLQRMAAKGGSLVTREFAQAHTQYNNQNFKIQYLVAAILLLVVAAVAVFLSRKISPLVGGLTGIAAIIPIVFIIFTRSNQKKLRMQLDVTLNLVIPVWAAVQRYLYATIEIRQNAVIVLTAKELQAKTLTMGSFSAAKQQDNVINADLNQQADRVAKMAWRFSLIVKPQELIDLQNCCTIFAQGNFWTYITADGTNKLTSLRARTRDELINSIV